MCAVSSTATSTSSRLDSPLYRAISDMTDETSAGVCSLARVRCVISLGYVQMEGEEFGSIRGYKGEEKRILLLTAQYSTPPCDFVYESTRQCNNMS